MTAGDLWELLREAELVRDIAWVLANADERRGCEEVWGALSESRAEHHDEGYQVGYGDGYSDGFEEGSL